MQKFALCIPRDSVAIDFAKAGVQPVPDELFSSAVNLAGRSFCETDESLLQFIPYITLRNATGRIFCYERGTAGAEDRLHAKLSIGLGGHVDDMPPDEMSLERWLLSEGERELLEEAGIAADLTGFGGLIYTGSNGNAVDKVHLGLFTEYHASVDQILSTEAGVIENGKFLSLTELLLPEVFERLEPWSQAVVTWMRERLSRDLGSAMLSFGRMLSSITVESMTGVTSAAAQEVGAVLSAVGKNIGDGHASARVYDAEFMGGDLDDVVAHSKSIVLDICEREGDAA